MPLQNEVLDWSQLRAIRQLQAEGEPDVVGRMIAMFREDAPARMARVRIAAERGDCKAMRFEAHSLRGTAGLIGASILHDVSTEIERFAEANDIGAAVGRLDAVTRAVDDVLQALSDGNPDAL